jgi:hypothetical protein
MKADQLVTPTGVRIFSPDDWIVTVYTSDGKSFKKGVQPEAEKEEAIHAVLRTCQINPSMIKDIDIRRRRQTV